MIATHQDSTTYTIIKDHLGSTRLVLDEDWAVVSWYDYAPFGKISRSGTGTQLNYRYTGQERDGATGLMNYRARMYDPSLGRFYAVDPAGQFASPYLYAANNPLSFTDPDGEWVWTALYYAYKAYRVYSTVNMAYQMYDAYQKGGVSAMVQTGMAMGFSHAIGSAVGPNINFGTKIGETIASGALSSALSGGAVSSMFGGSFGEGALRGGISGGLSAGIGWFGTHASLNMQATAQGLTDDPVDFTNEALHGFAYEHFGAKEGEKGLGRLHTATENDLPPGYVLRNGAMIDKRVGGLKNFFLPRRRGGATYAGKNGLANVAISKSQFKNSKALYTIVGHELIHVHHYYIGLHGSDDPDLFTKRSEYAAYQWNVRIANANGWKGIVKQLEHHLRTDYSHPDYYWEGW